ncbi:MAG TPA: SIR2 family protein [Pyrinomonadaceae bacterium]|nr:SIR2 family protein [Pyrinomonadaceae bacterium]
MGNQQLVITEAGFLTEFVNQHIQQTQRSFCFILGAGVSRSSGIATGGEMANIWLSELYEAENFDGLSLEEWATPERLGIDGFQSENLARFYPQLYQQRYGDHEQAGYAFLESQMEGKEPSYGYSVLSYLLSETSHRVVITTNFDNLVSDALSIHSSRFPIVIGHDTLAQYAAVELRRPLIAKIHGALGFSPKSHPEEISLLPEGWRNALARILDHYTPIVIGYEGNDGSLMGFLKSLPPQIPDRVFWCVYAPDAGADCVDRVSPDVCDYVKSRHGRLVPIRGFDQLMAKLLSKLREKGSVPDLYERLKERARQRERSYDEQQRKLYEAGVSSEPVRRGKAEPVKQDSTLSRAVTDIADSRKEKPWWKWSEEASVADKNETKRSILEQGIEALPNSPQMHREYAGFLAEQAGEMDKADAHYQRSLSLDAKDPVALAFYGDFFDRHRKDPIKAESYLRRAFEIDSTDDYVITRYANFLWSMMGEMDRAEELFELALKLHPNYQYLLKTYPQFLRNVRGDEDKAIELEQRLEKSSTG